MRVPAQGGALNPVIPSKIKFSSNKSITCDNKYKNADCILFVRLIATGDKMSPKKRTKKKSKRDINKPELSSKRGQLRVWWIAFGLVIIAAVILLFAKQIFFRTGSKDLASAAPADKSEFQPLAGDWMRPDGGYVIKIRHIDKSGRVDAGYFNPRPINVSSAFASTETGRLNLFIKLQDKGYPGSTYTLIYNEENDMLVGIYYQAALRQSFEVAFVRKK